MHRLNGHIHADLGEGILDQRGESLFGGVLGSIGQLEAEAAAFVTGFFQQRFGLFDVIGVLVDIRGPREDTCRGRAMALRA